MLAKRFPEAQAKFEQVVNENPRFAEAHNNLRYTLRKQGAANYQKSREHYNTAIELKPKLAEAYMYRGEDAITVFTLKSADDVIEKNALN